MAVVAGKCDARSVIECFALVRPIHGAINVIWACARKVGE
jgi:hypothetical protein